MNNKSAITRIKFLLDVGGSDGFNYLEKEALEAAIKALEAEPVRNGHWETIYGFDGDVYYRCSICETEWKLNDGNPKSNGWKYCPRCGKPMDAKG